jgi:hypothetical protein
MAEPRTCFVCGKAHGRESRVCGECASAYGPDRPFAPLADLPATAAVETPAANSVSEAGGLPNEPAEMVDVHRAPNPDVDAGLPEIEWDDTDVFAPQAAIAEPAPARGVPLPPQLQPKPQATPAPVAEPAAPVTDVVCGECGKVAQSGFSFCTGCGADLPGAAVAAQTPVSGPAGGSDQFSGNAPSSSPLSDMASRGIRDTRERVRRIAEAYDNAVSSADDSVGRGQRQAQRPVSEQDSADAESVAPKPVSPFSHGVLSFFFPGVGQILNGQPSKGVLLIIAGFVSVTLIGLGPWAIPVLVCRALVAMDAYRIASRRLAGEAIDPNEWDLT